MTSSRFEIACFNDYRDYYDSSGYAESIDDVIDAVSHHVGCDPDDTRSTYAVIDTDRVDEYDDPITIGWFEYDDDADAYVFKRDGNCPENDPVAAAITAAASRFKRQKPGS